MVSVFPAIAFALLLLFTFETVSADSPPPPDFSMDSLFEFPLEPTDFDNDDLLLVPAPSPQTLADVFDDSPETITSAAPSPLPPSSAPAPSHAPNSHSPAPAPNSPSPAPNSPSPAPNFPPAPIRRPPAPNSHPDPSPPSPPRDSPSPAPTPTPVPSPSDNGGTRHETNDSGGLSGGQKAGIAFGVIGAACLIGVGGYVYKKRQENIRRSQFGYRGGIEML